MHETLVSDELWEIIEQATFGLKYTSFAIGNHPISAGTVPIALVRRG
jgi:hypothetical protein